jgi:transketolase
MDCAKSTRHLISIEDHGPAGGLGEAIAAELAGKAPLHIMAVRDIPRSGKPEELLDAYGISAGAIVRKISELV